MECIEYLEGSSHNRTALAFIQRIDDGGRVLEAWNAFIVTAKRNGEERRHRRHRGRSGFSEKQKEVRRCMKWLAHKERERLGKSLERLQDPRKLDCSSDSESGED